MAEGILIERNGCIFDKNQLARSHGYETLDPVAQEAFVNHIHLDGVDREEAATRIVKEWAVEMRAKWPGAIFRIYVQRDSDELIVRFHRQRPELPDWSTDEEALSITTVSQRA